MTMKLGAFFPTRDMPADPEAVRAWAEAAEGLGFDYIEVSDHVLGVDRTAVADFDGPYDLNDSFHEVFVTLGFIAGVTRNIGLATGVLVLPQRQSALVAKQASQIDVLCAGRLRLGVGVGWNRAEYEALGEQWETRGRRQAEQIELMNRLWTEDSVTFSGEFDSCANVGLNPRPVQRPIPVWFGGAAPAALDRAARLGQGWIPLGRAGETTRSQLAFLRERLQVHGRSPEAFGVEAWIRSAGKDAPAWVDHVDQWRELGANHATFYTSGQGIGGVSEQIDAMTRFIEAVRGADSG